MDGLSLLCNLHADGPLSLRRLRAAGVHTLADLGSVPESTLASCLGSVRDVRRFAEEGRQLALRLAESPLEAEACTGPAPDPRRPPGVQRAAGAGGESAERPPRASGAPRTWSAPFPAAEQALEAGRLGGLDERTRERLAGEGVRSLEALVQRADLALARAAGIPYAKLLDLASQARLALAGAPGKERAVEILPEAPRRAASFASPPGANPRGANPPGASPLPAAGPARLRAGDPGPAGPFG